MIQVSVRRFIRDNHVKEIILQREARCAELETAGQVDTETEFDCREIVLQFTGDHLKGSLNLKTAKITIWSLMHSVSG